jgi:hypothetical protein
MIKYTYTNKTGVPESFAAVLREVERRSLDEGAFASASEIAGPPHQFALRRLVQTLPEAYEVEQDLVDLLWSTWGRSMHHLLEEANAGKIVRTTFRAEVAGRLITGEPDVFDPETGLLQDLKVSSVWKAKQSSDSLADWSVQLSVYAYLLEANGFKVREAEVVLLCRDWSRSASEREAGYPAGPIVRIPISIARGEEAEALIAERLEGMALAWREVEAGRGGECTPEERWEKAPTFAVIKQGNVKATKLFSNEDEARDFAAPLGARVERRGGGRLRCESYCKFSNFCPGWTAAKGEVK